MLLMGEPPNFDKHNLKKKRDETSAVCCEMSGKINEETSTDDDETDTLPYEDDDEEAWSDEGMDIFTADNETVDLKTSLLIEIFQHPMAEYWETATNHQPYALNSVKQDSGEFEKIRLIFEATSSGRKIVTLQRVENPYLLARYLLKREKLKMEQQVVQELSLFHGTHEKNVDSICKLNFNWRKCVRAAHGRGVYFATKSSIASNYSDYNSTLVMFLVKVLISGDVTVGDHNTVVPPQKSNATGNKTKNIIVKYEDDEFFPQYVIYFTQIYHK